MYVVVHDVETVSRDVHYWIISEDIQREALQSTGRRIMRYMQQASCVVLVFTGFNFAILAEADMLFYCSSTILKFGALVSLRWQMPYAERPFSIPFGNLGLVRCGHTTYVGVFERRVDVSRLVFANRYSWDVVGGDYVLCKRRRARAVENMIPFDEDEDNKGG